MIGAGTIRIDVHAKNYLDQYFEMKERFGALQGTEPYENKRVPMTTLEQVLAITRYWSSQLMRFAFSGIIDRQEIRNLVNEGQRPIALEQLGLPLPAIYPENGRAWDGFLKVSILLNALNERPSEFEMAWESVKESVSELPERIGIPTLSKWPERLFWGAVIVGGLGIGIILISRK
jgi:hypothetical protein